MSDKTFSLVHPDAVRAFTKLNDSEEAMRFPLEESKAAGVLDLLWSLFPPRGVSRVEVAVDFTFQADNARNLRVSLLPASIYVGSGRVVVYGLITPNQCDEISKRIGTRIEVEHQWVAVAYDPRSRCGHIHILNHLWSHLVSYLKWRDSC